MTLTIGTNVTLPAAKTGYVVIDRKTDKQATRTTYATRKAASRAADKLDLEYGAYRYSVKPL